MTKAVTEMKRYPQKKNDPLQAWDSADELLLSHVKSLDLTHKKILIINDQFGALSCALDEFDCETYTDSFISSMGIYLNSDGKIPVRNSLADLKGPYDFALIQLPKNMSFFEDILCHMTKLLRPNAKVICTGMVKHLAPHSFELLNKYIGETSTSLAQKKARLIFADFTKEPMDSPYPLSLNVEGFPIPLINGSNLFSREKLDIGTRFFLEHLPRGNFSRILDLGCANGIIGLKARELNPQAKILFSDESAMAIESAKKNYQNYYQDEAEFYWTNCFENQSESNLDLVLCNPPFHQQNTIGDFIAWQMFQDSFRALKTGGRIRVIGNSHLGYQIKLKKIFGNSKIVATNKKFMIVDAVK